MWSFLPEASTCNRLSARFYLAGFRRWFTVFTGQLLRVSEFLGIEDLEQDFLLLLLNREREGTSKLESYFDEKILAAPPKNSKPIRYRARSNDATSKKMRFIDKVDDFFEAIDVDNFQKAVSLMERANVDAETIAIVLDKMADGDGDY